MTKPASTHILLVKKESTTSNSNDSKQTNGFISKDENLKQVENGPTVMVKLATKPTNLESKPTEQKNLPPGKNGSVLNTLQNRVQLSY